MLTVLGLHLTPQAGAQTPPLVSFREIASLGPVTGPGMVAETHLAVSNSHVFAVHIQDSNPDRNGYAVKDKSTGTWSSGSMLNLATDPSVAYDAASDRFVICELKGNFAAKRIHITWWDPATGFTPKSDAIVDTVTLDKPWIVRGQNSLWRQEFYVTAHKLGESWYGRSLDGGQTWLQGGMGVHSSFCSEPSVATSLPTSPLYVVWTKSSFEHQFLRGDDNGTAVDFVPLVDSMGWPIEVVPNRNSPDLTDKAPGPFRVYPSPHLAADPTNPDRLYFVYFDLVPASSDLDVFCVRLDRSGGSWSVGAPVRVNDDTNPLNDHSDQIQPDLAVDEAGRVHVVFYDDRNYTNPAQPDTQDDNTKYDVYYAYSLDAGQTFINIKLAANPDQPALDHSLTPVNDNVPLEYPGITTFDNEVWVSFAGTYDQDTTTPDKSVIYVTKIVFGS